MTTPTPQPPRPVADDRPVVDQRDPDELRADLEERRRDLGDTVEELVHRVDVPTRMREKKDETVARVQQQVAQTTETVQQKVAQGTAQVRQQAARAQETLAEKAPAVERTMREQPAGLVAMALAVLGFVLLRSRRRRKARRRNEE